MIRFLSLALALCLSLMLGWTSQLSFAAHPLADRVLAYHTQPVRGYPVTTQQRYYYPTQSAAQSYSQHSPNTILQQLKTKNRLSNVQINSIRIVESNQLNAATDGQTIYLTSRLWNTLQNNDQRAFVISHELAHIVANHVPETQVRRTGLSVFNQYVLGQLLPDSRWADLASQVGVSLLDKRFSRNMEYEADDLGLRMMRNAGYDPGAAIRVLTVLDQASPGYVPEFLSDHPLDRQRIVRLAQKYDLATR